MSAAVSGGCAGDRCAGLTAAPGDAPGHLPGWTVCLAIVGSFGVALALTAALLLRRASVAPGDDRCQPSSAGSRVPPPSPGMGQRAAAVSVLRT
ncbi:MULTISPECIES: hypothetical protein [unclassified Micromonospora]|uniref:hypothetical protein n=1 Tax=unclassified Micromonospora TaxID=2617518 RepID=UPI001C245189|nr:MULTISPECIES: hypothetical protein [unclassified Micromonospora]MBU8855841.1 hypothetical protein [Micromonospora sp. WMMB482]MDM4781443.1 hypothetical protein [Micromonospora sp. b486]